MLQKPSTCANCVLCENNLSTGFAPAFGKGSLGILVIAESLGEHEAREGRPLAPKAQAGSVFARALKRMGLDEQQFVIINTVNCRPQHNRLEGEWYEDAAIEHCRRHIDEAVERFKPRAILTLGNVALRALTGLAGSGRSASTLRGYALPATTYTTAAGAPIPVIPSYHPSFISRGNEKYLGVLMHDIGKAVRIAQGKLVEGRDFLYEPFLKQWDLTEYQLEYITSPTPTDVRNFLEEIASSSEAVIAYDIETSYSTKKGEDEYEIESDTQITQVQFSLHPRSGIALPFDNTTYDVIRRVLESRNPKAGHNAWRFDNPILRAAGFSIAGTNYDTMTMFHHLQPDLPADLQFVSSFHNFPFPWKHYASSDLAFYGIADADAVQHIMARLPEDMRKRGVWDSYCEYVLKLQPILEGMQRRGIRIDLPARAEFKREIETEKAQVNNELQLQVPSVVKPKQVYKDWPEEAREYIKQIQESNVIIGPKGGKKLPVVKMSAATAPNHIVLDPHQRAELVQRLGESWRYDNGSLLRVDDFLPNSTAHLKKLITYFKEPIPKDLDDDETTARPELEKLIDKLRKEGEKLEKKRGSTPLDKKRAGEKYQLANLITNAITYRKLNKISATYIDGWKTDEAGYVHTTFTFRTATWQLSSLDPNVQNGPAHGKLAEKFKRLQIASPGCTLIAADYGGCHLKTLAFEMEDLNYYRMANIDGHSTIGLLAMKLATPEKLFEMTDEEWRDRCKWFRADSEREFLRSKRFKPALLGIQLGLGANKLYEMNKSGFANKKEAADLIDLIKKGIFPKIDAWQRYIRDLAHRQGFLLSRYGGIRWFWSVKRWDAKSMSEVPGEDAEAALAFFVQNDAFGKKRESMLDFEQEGLAEKYGMVNDIHDAAYFDCPNEYLDQAILDVRRIMESPARKLVNKTFPEGLKIGVEIKIGPNLADLKLVNVTDNGWEYVKK
jgi:uracil-DNA glycosylase family 4